MMCRVVASLGDRTVLLLKGMMVVSVIVSAQPTMPIRFAGQYVQSHARPLRNLSPDTIGHEGAEN